MESLEKICSVCGEKLSIKINRRTGKYFGGHYFGPIKVPYGAGERVKVGEFKLGRKRYDVVKWTGNEKKVELWECNKCYSDED